VAGVLLALTVPAGAQEYGQERFQLFNDCSPMGLLVEGMDENAAAIDLTVSDLRVVAESRLRSARIYTEDDSASRFAFLYVNCIVTGTAFSLDLNYIKWVEDVARQSG